VKKEEGNERERERESTKVRIGRYTRQWKKSEEEESSQVLVVRETSTEVVPIFANAVFGEMQIHYSFDGLL